MLFVYSTSAIKYWGQHILTWGLHKMHSGMKSVSVHVQEQIAIDFFGKVQVFPTAKPLFQQTSLPVFSSFRKYFHHLFGVDSL